MNQRIEHCLYQAGLTAQGCWDELDDYARQGIEKFAQLIVEECCVIVNQEALLTDHVPAEMNAYAGKRLKNAYIKIEQHFGVEE